MFGALLHINVPGTQRALLRNRNSPISTCQLPTSYVRLLLVPPPWPPGARGLHFLFLDVGHQGFGGQRQGGDRRGVQAGAGRQIARARSWWTVFGSRRTKTSASTRKPENLATWSRPEKSSGSWNGKGFAILE